MRFPSGPWTRRRLLHALVLAPAAFVVAKCGGDGDDPTDTPGEASPSASPTQPSGNATTETATKATATLTTAATLTPTPACGDDDEPTLAQTEGPFFTPDSPERSDLTEPGMAGTRLTVSGFVLSTACAPVAKALVDFWQADDNGEYDNSGYRLRGHVFTGDDGSYAMTTILPGLYTGRTRHIHVKVQAPGQPVLTTQLYFPDEPANARDGIFDPALVMEIEEGTPLKGRFTFVLDV